MKRLPPLLAAAALVLAAGATDAQTVVGDLNNFDTLNDTGQTCYGFEIEIDDIHSTDITYTFDWNHYGVPQIREDNTDPVHPKVFVRYQSTKDGSGAWGANGSLTNIASPTLTPPQGHTCTDTSVNEGCEHFGVGYYGTPTTVKYHWLIDDNAGGLAYFGTPVGVATPKWTYTPPAPGIAAQAVAVIPAPVVPVAGKEFGEPSWVKVIKTTAHNANPVALADLVSDDRNGDGLAEWQNNEPDEVETEWKLLQATNGGNGPNEALAGGGDDMGDGSEVVTRRYEFYKYGGSIETLDGETGEAMCSEVQLTTDANDPLYKHGVGTQVAVTDANGDTQYVDCQAQVVVGDYIGAQMAGFDAAAPLGLVEHLQEGERDMSYLPRTVVVGGNAPYTITISNGSLPPGMSIGDYVDPQTFNTARGVLFGLPTSGGDYPFTVEVTDASNATTSQTFSLHIIGAPAEQFQLSVQKSGSGDGTVTGNDINCGATCSHLLDKGTAVSLSASPAAGSRFAQWGGDCAGTAGCAFTLSASSLVTAEFTKQWLLTVTKAGGGTGTVSGSGIDCGSTCEAIVDEGASMSLAALATGGSVFTGWSGDCTGLGTCSPAMTAARSVIATFVPPTQAYTLTVAVAGSGSVGSAPKGINCGKQCSKDFVVGTTVTLTAKTPKKHQFLGWTGACVSAGTSLNCSVPILKAETVGAVFN